VPISAESRRSLVAFLWAVYAVLAAATVVVGVVLSGLELHRLLGLLPTQWLGVGVALLMAAFLVWFRQDRERTVSRIAKLEAELEWQRQLTDQLEDEDRLRER